MQKIADKWLRAILAGFMIAVGGTLFLSVDSKYMGSFLFGIGLFTILVFRLFLFTGKVGYAVQEKPAYLVDLLIIWLGNLIGTVGVGLMMLQTRSADALRAKAAAMCQIKLNDSLVSIFVLSIFCGVMMFLAADNFKKAENAMQKNIGIFLPVMVRGRTRGWDIPEWRQRTRPRFLLKSNAAGDITPVRILFII